LDQPNDNVLAQARWASTHKLIELDPALLQMPSAFEARAWYAFYEGEWAATLKAGKRWLRDQPFSTSPAIHSSYVATISLEKHEEAIKITEDGLLANPNDVTLLNNQSYSLACLGKTEEAAAALGRINRHSLNDETRVLIAATSGLILYRQGNAEAGRAMYQQAISQAASASKKTLEAKAALFLAFEELRSGSPDALTAVERALHLSSADSSADFRLLRERLKNAIETYQSPRALAKSEPTQG
jgi:tetratricopeptide (TPR) repeat protein